jgi:hypothetical protein
MIDGTSLIRYDASDPTDDAAHHSALERRMRCEDTAHPHDIACCDDENNEHTDNCFARTWAQTCM